MKRIKWLHLLIIATMLVVLIPTSAGVVAQEPQRQAPDRERREAPRSQRPGGAVQEGPQMPIVEAPPGVRTPEQALRIIDPELRPEARAGGEELVKVTVLVQHDVDLARYFDRLRVVEGPEFNRVVGLVKADDLIKLATVPATLAILNMETRQAPQPPDPFALLGEADPPERLTRSLEDVNPPDLSREERMFGSGPRTTEGNAPQSFYTNDTNGVWETWSQGITGDGDVANDPVKLAVVDTGVDFANPDLFGTQARVWSPNSNYYDASGGIGWPIAFDDRSMSDFALDVKDYRGNWGWYMNAFEVIQDPDLGSLDPFTFTVDHPDLGMEVVYTISSTVQSWNTNGGLYRFGWHPDDTLAAQLGETPGVLVTGEDTAGTDWGLFDTIYVDILPDYLFDAGAFDAWAFLGQEIACINLGWSAPGACDLSAGMIYYIADGKTPVPGSDWLYGLPPILDDGSVVAFMLNDVTENGGDHGTLCAGTAVGQGNIVEMPYGGTYGDIYWPPSWYNPGVDGGISQGPGRDTKLVAIGNYYAGGSSLNNYDFVALGYDGLPAGHPNDANDQPHIYTNSYGSGAVENDGWNLSSRYVSLINRGYVAQQGLALPDGGDHSPLFVGSTGNSGFGYGTVTSPQPETAVMVGVETVFGQFNLGDTALSRDWVNWGQLGGFSDRGPTSMSTLGVHTLANGFFGSGNIPLNYLIGGDWAVDFWAGTSRSGPEAGGILALIYDAFWQKHGRYPTWYEARNLLMNGNRAAFNDPKAGPGLANALNAVEIVTGTRGLMVSSSEGDGYWIPGEYRGDEFPGFARGLFSGESDTEVFSVTNHGDAAVTANLAPVSLEMYDSRDWNFTTLPLDDEGPGTRYYGRRLYGPPDSNPGYEASDPFFDSTDPADVEALTDADLMVVRMSWPESQFQENPGANWWFLYAAAWRDVDVADSSWFTDTNANGVMNSGEFQDEWVRISYDYHGNTAEVRIREPMNLINGEVWENEPALAAMDDILIMPRHFYYGGFDTTDLKITVELYEEVEWAEITLDTGEVTVPAGSTETFEATADTILASNVYLDEDFETWPLSGWNIANNGGDCVWREGSGDSFTNVDPNFTGGSGEYADADSDECGPATLMDTELRTPVMDLSAETTIILEFKWDYDTFSGLDTADVDVSNDGGSTWTNVWSRSGSDYWGPNTTRLDISALAAGQSNVMVRFYYYDAEWEGWWQVDDVRVYSGVVEPPGEYAGYIKLTYTEPYTYSEYLPVEKQIWFPADIDPVLGGVEQPYPYSNGEMFGGRGPSSTGERAESGDWRFFYTDVVGQPDPGSYLLAHTTWEAPGTPPWATDLDTLFYGPVPHDPLFTGFNNVFGPHGLEVVGGSLRAGSAPDWDYHTSTGGPSDWNSIPMENEGLYGVAAQVVRWGGEMTRVPYTITVGTVQATPEVVMEGLTCLSCTVPIYFKTNHEDLAGRALDAIGYGFNQPVHETLPVTQSESTFYNYTITAEDAYKLQVNTFHPNPSVDVDLVVYYEGTPVGSSGRSDSNEQVLLSNPPAGEYQIELYGYGIPMGITPTALDIVEISGAGAMTVGNLPTSIETGVWYEMDLHFETRPDFGVWTGLVFLGPEGSPTAVEIPVTLYQGDAEKMAWQDSVLPGELVTYTLTLTASPGGPVWWNLVDSVPAGMEFVSVEGADYNPVLDQIEWTGYLGSGGAVTEGFESGMTPPPGWTQEISNTAYTWLVTDSVYIHSGAHGAYVPYDYDQDEWLLSPEVEITSGMLDLWSQGSVYWCRDTNDNCDVNAWLVVGAVGGLDDVLLGQLEDDWPANWTWTQGTFNLTPHLPGGPVRIGLQYVGSNGADAAVDDVTLITPIDNVTHTITLTLRATELGNPLNTAYVTTGPNVCPIEDTVSVVAPTLYITKSVAPGSQYPGLPVTYTLVFGNKGDADAVGVVVSDVLPAEVEYAWSDPMGVYTDHDVVWGPMTLTAGAEVTATLVVTVGSEVTPPLTLTNTAYLFWADETYVTEASHQVVAPTLYITKSVAPGSQYPGLPVTYTLVFGNKGDADAVGVVVSDVLPAEVEYAWSDPMGVYTDHDVVWGPMTLTAGAEVTATLVVTVGSEVTPPLTLTNTAYLFWADETYVTEASHQVVAPPVEFYYYYLPVVFKNY